MRNGIRKVFLHPGDFVFGEPGTHVHTVLGSCIAICLWHPVLRIGGMCHFVLPSRPPCERGLGGLNGRYGDEAMRLFDTALELHQTDYREYQAKIFGGADMLGERPQRAEESVGERNVARAMTELLGRNVEILVAHVGERGHRRIAMDISTGDVWVRYQAAAGEPAMRSQSGVN